jgi:hypothetical protein
MTKAEELAYYLDHQARAKRPGTQEFAEGARKDVFPNAASLLEASQIPLIADAASLALYANAEVNGDAGGLQRALSLAALLPFVPGVIGKSTKSTQPWDKAHNEAQQAAAQPKTEWGGLGLPKNNTAMDRAKALGYNTDAYHYSSAQEDFDAFHPSSYVNPWDTIGTHSGTEKAAEDRFNNTRRLAYKDDTLGYTLPLLLPDPPMLRADGTYPPGTLDEYASRVSPQHHADTGAASEYNGDSYLDEFRKADKLDQVFQNQDTMPYLNAVEDPDSISYITNPKKVRSRFAAFDPRFKDSANIMAGSGAAALLLQYLREQEQEYE